MVGKYLKNPNTQRLFNNKISCTLTQQVTLYSGHNSISTCVLLRVSAWTQKSRRLDWQLMKTLMDQGLY